MPLCFLYPSHSQSFTFIFLTSIFSAQIASLMLPGFGPSWESPGAALFQFGPTGVASPSHSPLRETPWNYSQSCLCVCVCVFLGRHTVADPMDYYTIHNSPCPWPPLSKRLKRSNFRFQLSHLDQEGKHAFLNKQQSLTRRKYFHLCSFPLFLPRMWM